ncbi:MAG: caspase family protein [Bradyrhizobium sp.]|nr:caspase family protein [Bradyrhizobium sp.]
MGRARANAHGLFGRLLWLTALFALISPSPAAAGKRVALVIGNSAYRNVARLDNPAKDAALIADTLSAIGFILVGGGAQLDLDKDAMADVVQRFGRQLDGADVALFYYAGHGVQVAGQNYLVPVGANPTRQTDVDWQMIEVNKVLNQMQASGTRLNLVILDACRNNPFGGRGLRATGGGLAQMQAPDGTVIAYATQPGAVAQDGSDGHSPYTKALAETIRRPGLSIFDAFNAVGVAVKHATGDAQQPWLSSSPIDGTFYFVPPAPQTQSQPPQVAVTQPVDPLRADPDRVPLTDAGLLAELSERLYEHNFDPQTPDGKDALARAITQFQQRASLAPTGEATEGLLNRLRQMGDPKPWGSIVYDPDTNKYGISWKYQSRRSAVNVARGNCGASRCAVELSFYGDRCGAFAVPSSGRAWSLLQRDTPEKAKQAALDECGKAGKSCRIIDAVCADGRDRS